MRGDPGVVATVLMKAVVSSASDVEVVSAGSVVVMFSSVRVVVMAVVVELSVGPAPEEVRSAPVVTASSCLLLLAPSLLSSWRFSPVVLKKYR